MIMSGFMASYINGIKYVGIDGSSYNEWYFPKQSETKDDSLEAFDCFSGFGTGTTEYDHAFRIIINELIHGSS